MYFKIFVLCFLLTGMAVAGPTGIVTAPPAWDPNVTNGPQGPQTGKLEKGSKHSGKQGQGKPGGKGNQHGKGK